MFVQTIPEIILWTNGTACLQHFSILFLMLTSKSAWKLADQRRVWKKKGFAFLRSFAKMVFGGRGAYEKGEGSTIPFLSLSSPISFLLSAIAILEDAYEPWPRVQPENIKLQE